MSLPDSSPPVLPRQSSSALSTPPLAVFLSVALMVFVADAGLSLAGDSLVLLTGNPLLSIVSGLVALPALLLALAVYVLMALTPRVPKRVFLPLTLFGPVASLASLPLLVYFHQHSGWIAWGISLARLVVCLVILRHLWGSWKFRWPLIDARQLGSGGFRWRHFTGFVAAHLLLALPATLAYLLACASLAVDHFSDGFVTLRPSGLTMQVRKYSREDGKIVELVPMSHIGEPDFYQTLAASFPKTATLLMEGVSDKDHLFSEKLSYRETAKSLGLVEQQDVFKPPGEKVPADVDINQFSKTSLEFLKRALPVHSQGVKAGTLPMFVESPPPAILQGLINDLLSNRNRHLLEVFNERLSTSDHIVIPWGAAHMPGISEGVLKAGFHLQETEDHVAIKFWDKK